MREAWYYDGSPDKEDHILTDTIVKCTKNLELANTLTRFWNLYQHLEKDPPNSALDLREKVLINKEDKSPFFTEEVSERVVMLLPIVKSKERFTKYIKDRILRIRAKKKQVGAGAFRSETQTLDELVNWVVTFAPARLESLGFNSANPTLFGKVANVTGYMQWILTIPMRIIPWLESNPYLGGPLWRAAINIVLELLPQIILIQNVMLTALATPLAPFGIGFLIEALSIFIATTLGMITFILSLAANRKGAAFLSFIELTPIIGPMIRLLIMRVVRMYDVVSQQRQVLGKLPLVGQFIAPRRVYAQPPPIQQQNVTGRARTYTRRNRRSDTKPAKMGRARRRITADW